MPILLEIYINNKPLTSPTSNSFSTRLSLLNRLCMLSHQVDQPVRKLYLIYAVLPETFSSLCQILFIELFSSLDLESEVFHL